MFDSALFIDDCRTALAESNPVGAVRELLTRELAKSSDVATTLGRDEAGLEVLYNSEDLTVLNVIWAPGMTLYPHDHRMWAAIGIYGGQEDNRFYRRGEERLQEAGERTLETGDVFSLGPDAIHAVHNPRPAFTGAIHVYGGDFVNAPRSQWDPDRLLEEPFDFAQVRALFAQANEEWRSQLGHDVDEHVY